MFGEVVAETSRNMLESCSILLLSYVLKLLIVGYSAVLTHMRYRFIKTVTL